jgi:hypothetical protein
MAESKWREQKRWFAARKGGAPNVSNFGNACASARLSAIVQANTPADAVEFQVRAEILSDRLWHHGYRPARTFLRTHTTAFAIIVIELESLAGAELDHGVVRTNAIAIVALEAIAAGEAAPRLVERVGLIEPVLHLLEGCAPALAERELRPETSGGEAGLPSQTTPVQEIIDWTGSGARLAACIAGQCRCDFRDRQRQPGADFPRPRPGRFFDGTRPAELLSRCALVIADLSLHPVSFRETFVTRLYRFSTVVSHSVPSSRAVSILSDRLSYLFALRRVWAGLSQRIICH